jgi:hypothetical protein
MKLHTGNVTLAIPMRHRWWSYETCTLKRIKAGVKKYQRASEFFGIEVTNEHYWILEYGGEATEYDPDKPELGVLEKALNAAQELPLYRVGIHEGEKTQPFIREYPEPPEKVVEFFKEHGPLGLFFACADRVNRTPANEIEVVLRDTPDLAQKTGKSGVAVDYEAYWRLFNSSAKPINPNYVGAEFYRGCYEDWFLIYEELADLARAWNWWKMKGIIDPLNRIIKDRLKAGLEIKGTDVNWSFAFSSLRDALYGQMAKTVVGKVDFRQCGHCGRLYNYTELEHKRPVYCSEECALKAAYKQKEKERTTPLIREKRRLKELVRARAGWTLATRNHPSITWDDANRILLQINEANTLAKLQAIEKKYASIFKKRTPGPKPG